MAGGVLSTGMLEAALVLLLAASTVAFVTSVTGARDLSRRCLGTLGVLVAATVFRSAKLDRIAYPPAILIVRFALAAMRCGPGVVTDGVFIAGIQVGNIARVDGDAAVPVSTETKLAPASESRRGQRLAQSVLMARVAC